MNPIPNLPMNPTSNNQTPALPEDVVLSVRHVSKKFCRDLKRSMLYGTHDLIRNMFSLRSGGGRGKGGGESSMGDSRLGGQLLSHPPTPNAPDEPNAPNLPPPAFGGSLRKGEFWSLSDVGFELRHGEIMGVIGDNGAGKTTLLRLISGIFPPDAGTIAVRGRVGALIALGAGFHPNMTGRENIYLNGAVLGMGRSEIERKFDSIIAFAGIDESLDAPVSTYSSGMYVRLGFAIAAHLEPELMIVDEILSVGDIAFRHKCMAFIQRLRAQGVAILYVSHDLSQVAAMATHCLWLDKGQVRALGKPSEVVAKYVNESNRKALPIAMTGAEGGQTSSGAARFGCVRTLNTRGEVCNTFKMGDDIVVELPVRVSSPIDHPVVGIGIRSVDGIKLILHSSRRQKAQIPAQLDHDCVYTARLIAPPLLAGTYGIMAGLGMEADDSTTYARWEISHRFSVVLDENDENATYHRYSNPLTGNGVMRVDAEWRLT